MYQKTELLKLKEAAEKRQAELENIKADGKKEWTPELQKELEEVTLQIVDFDEALAEKEASTYKPAPGEEKMLHLKIVRGRRFNPNTGKEESDPYVQKFTFAEWQIFKRNMASLGYHVLEVLHDPYNEASEFISK